MGKRVQAYATAAVAFAPGTAEAYEWPLWHPSPATPTMVAVESLHWLLLAIMVAICVLVVGLMAYVALRFGAKRGHEPTRTSHNAAVEILWTVLPVLVLVVIAVPSFRTLYSMDRTSEADLTIKIIGNQWYWRYEYPDSGIGFDSIPVDPAALKPGQARLLEAEPSLVVPAGLRIRLLVTAQDVLHSWGIPAFGVKVDAVPGRTNESWFSVETPGTYYGQCYEICGQNHYFMPARVEVVTQDAFAAWLARARLQNGGTDGR
jgi:cytochrome c oxidase subunit 2